MARSSEALIGEKSPATARARSMVTTVSSAAMESCTSAPTSSQSRGARKPGPLGPNGPSGTSSSNSRAYALSIARSVVTRSPPSSDASPTRSALAATAKRASPRAVIVGSAIAVSVGDAVTSGVGVGSAKRVGTTVMAGVGVCTCAAGAHAEISRRNASRPKGWRRSVGVARMGLILHHELSRAAGRRYCWRQTRLR